MKLRLLLTFLLLLSVCVAGFTNGIREEREAEDAVAQSEEAYKLNQLGLEYYNQGDYASAIECFIKAKDIYEKTVGKDHPYYANSLNDLSMSYLSDNKYPQSLEIKKEENRIRTEQVYRNFSFMSEQQREAFWKANSYSFEQVNSITFHHPIPESAILSYDNALFTKGLLLRTTNAVRDTIYSSGNDELIAQYEEMMRKRQQISNQQQSGGNENYIKQLEQEADAMEKSLNQASSAYAAANEDLQADLAINWQSIRDNLQADEAAIEFVSFNLYDKNWTGKTMYAALVLRQGMNAPQWVPLCEGSVLDDIYSRLEERFMEFPKYRRESYEKDGIRVGILYNELGADLYNAIWQPLEKALQGVTTIYYSPSGQLHKISFNSLPIEQDNLGQGSTTTIKRLTDKYDLNLVSSTREIVYRNKPAQRPVSAAVYGGLDYDLDPATMKKEALAYQKKETTTGSPSPALAMRGGRGSSWDYLEGTDSESKKVQELLNANKVKATLYNKAKGNKESFLNLDGKKVNILHLATHGFFVEDAKKDYEQQQRFERLGGGQRAFENPLLRSGLILSGGNNAWKGEPV